MTHGIQIRVLTLALVTALGLAPVAAQAAARAGKIAYAFGETRATGTDGRTRALRSGDSVFAGDLLLTERGRLHVRFNDGGFVSLQPDSRFRIDEYQYEGETDGSEKGFFSLLKGAVRAITGAIGRVNKQSYQVKTAVATIGIRGTAFSARLCSGDCFGPDGSLLPDGLYAKTGEGTIYIANAAGVLDLIAGQSGFVQDENSEPTQTDQPPPVGGLTPSALAADEGYQQGDQRDSEGNIADVGDTSGDLTAVGTILGPFGAVLAFNSSQNDPLPGEVETIADALLVQVNPIVAAIGTDVDDPIPGFAVVGTANNVTHFDDGELLIFRWSQGTVITDEDTSPTGFIEETLTGSQAFAVVAGTPTATLPLGGFADFELIPGASTPTGSDSGLATGTGATAGSFFIDFGSATINDFNMNVNHAGSNYNIGASSVPLQTFNGLFGPHSGTSPAASSGLFSASGGNGACASICGAEVGVMLIGNEQTVIGNTPTRAGVGYRVQETDPFSGVAGFTRVGVSPGG